MSGCSIYIIGHVIRGKLSAPVKVGITRSLGSRLCSLQTGNSLLLEVGFHFTLPTRQEAATAEREFHDTMADYRLQGEWFDLDPLYALETLTGIVYTLIEQLYEGDDRRQLIQASNASKNLRTVTTEFWGLPE